MDARVIALATPVLQHSRPVWFTLLLGISLSRVALGLLRPKLLTQECLLHSRRCSLRHFLPIRCVFIVSLENCVTNTDPRLSLNTSIVVGSGVGGQGLSGVLNASVASFVLYWLMKENGRLDSNLISTWEGVFPAMPSKRITFDQAAN